MQQIPFNSAQIKTIEELCKQITSKGKADYDVFSIAFTTLLELFTQNNDDMSIMEVHRLSLELLNEINNL